MRNPFLIAVALLLLGLQSCRVYKKTWITMDEAIQMEKKQKVKLVDPDSKKSVREYTILAGVKIHGDSLIGSLVPKDIVTGYKRPFHIRYVSPIPEPYRSYQVHLMNKKVIPFYVTVGFVSITLIFYSLSDYLAFWYCIFAGCGISL